jgi:HEPN domain-containing protein
VEKTLKGYLTYRQVRFSKTHDIATLLEVVQTVDPELAKQLIPAKRLTKYAIEYRYPDAANRPMTHAKAKSALVVANKVFEVISAKLRI